MKLKLHYINGKDEELELRYYNSNVGDENCYYGSSGNGTIGMFHTSIFPQLDSGKGLLRIEKDRFNVGETTRYIMIKNILWFELIE